MGADREQAFCSWVEVDDREFIVYQQYARIEVVQNELIGLVIIHGC